MHQKKRKNRHLQKNTKAISIEFSSRNIFTPFEKVEKKSLK